MTVIGHEKRWGALARAFGAGKIPQTLLVSGASHVGKWTLVRRYAQLLLCEAPTRDADGLPAPCGTCRACHQVEVETYPDFTICRPIVSSAKEEKDWVIAPEHLEGSLITVDVARKYGNEALRKPVAGPRKVMVFYQADRMNIESQNALLKTFEEPVTGLSIILVCDNPSGLLATVRSRCWHLPLGLASDSAIADWLRQSFPNVAPELVVEAARIAAGRPGAAWREMQRLQETEDSVPRAVQANDMIDRILRGSPVGAFRLTEDALKLAKEWWEEDAAFEARETKKADAKVARSAAARFLDELAGAYRVRWVQATHNGDTNTEVWASGLDQIRLTRHYILRNAGTNLALDVLFGRLIAAHRSAMRQPASRVGGAPGGRAMSSVGTARASSGRAPSGAAWS